MQAIDQRVLVCIAPPASISRVAKVLKMWLRAARNETSSMLARPMNSAAPPAARRTSGSQRRRAARNSAPARSTKPVVVAATGRTVVG